MEELSFSLRPVPDAATNARPSAVLINLVRAIPFFHGLFDNGGLEIAVLQKPRIGRPEGNGVIIDSCERHEPRRAHAAPWTRGAHRVFNPDHLRK